MPETVKMLVLNKSHKPIGMRDIAVTRDFMCYSRTSKDREVELVLVEPRRDELRNEGA